MSGSEDRASAYWEAVEAGATFDELQRDFPDVTIDQANAAAGERTINDLKSKEG